MMIRPESVVMGRDHVVLTQMFDFYAPSAESVRDVTANNKKMWKGVELPDGIMFYDIDSAVNPDIVCSWDNLPDSDNSVDVIVFDPPHLPLAAASKESHEQMGRDYGLSRSPSADNISGIFDSFLYEARRVLRDDGLIFAKIKDYVHNHKYQFVHADFISEVDSISGLTACDLIIKRDPAGGNLKSGRWQKAYHGRNCHCYWIIVRKGRCEPKNLRLL